MLLEVEETEISAEEMCAGKSVGSSCWMELTNQPECYVWNPHLQKDETVNWSGKCSGNLAHGDGTLTWAVTDGDSLKITSTSTGHLQKGNFHGQWIHRSPNGTVEEGPYVDGKKHGQWIWRSTYGHIHEGPYVEGKRHGQWVVRWRDRTTEKGLYKEGKRHGQWVVRWRDRTTEKGLYKEGRRHGQWVYSNPEASGDWGGLYVNGKRHGEWVLRYANMHWGKWGSKYERVLKGSYVDGKKHGQWVEHDRYQGHTSTITYVNGKEQ